MSHTQPDSSSFKECSLCGRTWETRDEFLADPDVRVVGYQMRPDNLTAGYFVFNHVCETSLAIMVREFCDLHKGPVYAVRKFGTDECPEYCLHEDELEPCPARCECAFVRDVLQRIRDWPKSPSTHSASI